jgi:hypothetical protein
MATGALSSNGLLYYAIYMYLGGMKIPGLSFAWKLGFHPVTLACLAVIFTSFPL